ncbi:hypothetical protein KVR01_012110 [Diaporthe batatas]|uniref:uncharacterized protein n=1 Tax=Diaporthe batatas TaxID=748121 RepID=UPI001D056540|nr:uncharacterized protein KVR01_012110 [Diaporthe batatas]KAG8158349.1 hypothetical protein KVR01_012110 [Diaporthe batatas]
MAPYFTKLKTISKRVEAKLNQVMCKLHMKKTVNKSEAAVEVELINTVVNEGQGDTIKPEPSMVDQGNIDMPNAAVETEVVNQQKGTTTKTMLANVDQATPTNVSETVVKSEDAENIQNITTKPTHTGQGHLSLPNKPDPAGRDGEERATAASPNDTGADGLQNSSAASSTKNLEKMAKRAGRRQARKAKWAARRTALKARSNKLVDAAFLPATIVSCILCSPLICVADITFTVIQGVVILIIRIVDVMCAPVLVCIMCRSEGH